jgi:hypothetical protein
VAVLANPLCEAGFVVLGRATRQWRVNCPTCACPDAAVAPSVESVEALDPAVLKLAEAVRNVVPVGAPRDALSGTWLGHALHPLLTDVVVGSFVSATLLDLLGGDDTGRASERLIEVGLATSVPTVARDSMLMGLAPRVGKA